MSTLATVETKKLMRAARIVAPQRMEVEEVPVPEPGPREVRIRVEGCGVCASNLGPWLGLPWMKYPLAPGQSGHEAWGEVDAVGREVTRFSPGQRVSAVSYHAYAEFDLASEDALVRLPAELDRAPFPGEALGCAMNVFSRARVERGQTVAIVGVGFMGALLTRLAADAGARVLAISRREHALGVAREMGASETIPMDDHRRIVDRVHQLTGGRLCDRVIEAVGLQWPLDLASELVRSGGVLVVAGYHQDGPRQVNMQLWNWRGVDVINAHEREIGRYVQGIEAAVAAVGSRALRPELLYTHRYPLHELGEALEATSQRPAGFMKALLMP